MGLPGDIGSDLPVHYHNGRLGICNNLLRVTLSGFRREG